MCCKLPSAVKPFGGGTGLCADKVPLTPYVTGRLQMFPWCSRVLLWSSLIFLCFPLVLKCFPSAPFSFPFVFLNFPLIFLVFGVNVNYNRKLIFWCAASRQVLKITIENQYPGVLQVAKCCEFLWKGGWGSVPTKFR